MDDAEGSAAEDSEASEPHCPVSREAVGGVEVSEEGSRGGDLVHLVGEVRWLRTGGNGAGVVR